MARVFEVALLDRLGPLEQLLHLRLAGHLVHGADDLHVSELAGLGHDQELEPVEPVSVVAEIVLHHLLGFLLGLAGLLLDRGLLSIEVACQLLAALLRLGGLLLHLLERAHDLVVFDELRHLLRRALRRLREPVDLRQLLVELGQLSHLKSPSVGGNRFPGYPATQAGNKVRMIARGKPLLAVFISMLVLAGPAVAAPNPTYVSLGDSYAAGPLIPLQVPLFGCLKSNNNYANLTARNLGITLKDASCSGAETEDMTSPQNVDPDGPNPPQFDSLTKQTRIVTLQIGGNDIGFSSIAEDCASATSNEGTPCQDR